MSSRAVKESNLRPKGINDLHVLWAIRDIPSSFLNLAEKGALCLFSAIIGNKPSCAMSFPELAEIMGNSPRNLRYIFNKLENKKFIFVTRHNILGRGKNNTYQLNYELILSFSNKANIASFNENGEKNGAKIALLPDEIGQNTSLNEAKIAVASIEREERDIKSRERGAPPVDNSQDQKPKLLARADFRFTQGEQAESYRRDIHIQACFDKFWEWVKKKGREKFYRHEWEKWFLEERDGKNAKPVVNQHYEALMEQHAAVKQEEIKYGKPRWGEILKKVKGQSQ